jgi:hypothetical protein
MALNFNSSVSSIRDYMEESVPEEEDPLMKEMKLKLA